MLGRDYISSKFRLISTQILFVFLFIIISPDWLTVTSQRETVQLCPQFSAPSPLVWEIWTWVTTTCGIQEWSSFLLDWRVQTVHWKRSGQNRAAIILIYWTMTININVNYSVYLSDSGTYVIKNIVLSTFLYFQSVRMSDHRERLCFSGRISALQPLPSERAGPQ